MTMASNDLKKVAETLFAMRPVRVTFHLPGGESVEAMAIGWEMRGDAVGRAVVTVMQPKAGLSMRTEG